MAEEELAWWFISGLLLIVTISWSRSSRNRGYGTKSELKLLPGPISLPIIGGILQIGLIAAKAGQHYQRLHNICKRYGRVMWAKTGSLQLAIIEDYATAREVYNSPDWTARYPSHSDYKSLTFGKDLGLLLSAGEGWKEMRRFVVPTLREFGFGELSVAEEDLTEELGHLIRHVDELRGKSNNTIRMNGLFKVPNLNMLWRILVGYRLDYHDKEITKIVHLIEQLTTTEFGLHLAYAFPWLKHIFPNYPPLASAKVHYGEICDYFKKLLDERRVAGVLKNSKTNFMDRFIEKIEEEKNNPNTFYTDEQLLCTCADLMGAALDTTSNSSDFALLYMLKYPDVQRKVHEELDRVVGRSRMPNVYDRAHLPYTEATMMETLRLCNVTPVGTRASTCDTVLNGCHVPEDTFALLNLTEIHMDKSIWGDPEAFRPERFLDANNKVIKDHKLLAFGGGKRLCIGHTMAKVVWIAFFATIMHRYTLEASKDHPEISTVPISGFTNGTRETYCTLKLRY